MPTTKKLIRVHLMNYQTIHAQCGYGEGRTHDEAVANALEMARQRDPNAQYDKQSGCVGFAGGINC